VGGMAGEPAAVDKQSRIKEKGSRNVIASFRRSRFINGQMDAAHAFLRFSCGSLAHFVRRLLRAPRCCVPLRLTLRIAPRKRRRPLAPSANVAVRETGQKAS